MTRYQLILLAAIILAALSSRPTSGPHLGVECDDPDCTMGECVTARSRPTSDSARLDVALLERAAWKVGQSQIEHRVREGELGWLAIDIAAEYQRLASKPSVDPEP